jgi:nitrate/TMAO reductase-like tetraheme cytochrome c subunit
MKTQFVAPFLVLCALSAMPVFATKMTMPSDAPKSYEAECASCHMAYPPRLLGQRSWQNIMLGLDKHFGTDASLDLKTQAEITQWLIKNAATKEKYSTLVPDSRITKTSWFIRKHDELRPEVWKRSGVKSPANCSACHADAVKGDFNEDQVRIPAK